MSEQTVLAKNDSTPSMRKPWWAFTSEPVIAVIVTLLMAGLIALFVYHYTHVHNVWDIIASVGALVVIASGVGSLVYYAGKRESSRNRDAEPDV